MVLKLPQDYFLTAHPECNGNASLSFGFRAKVTLVSSESTTYKKSIFPFLIFKVNDN